MLNKKHKIIILALILVLVTVGIGFTKVKLDSYRRIVYPALNIKCGSDTYLVDKQDNQLYKVYNYGRSRVKLIKDKIEETGIILFKDRLYFINKNNNNICSTDLNGKNLKVIDKCNIIMPYQPIFKLGNHVYYYDSNNVLTRLNNNESPEQIDFKIL